MEHICPTKMINSPQRRCEVDQSASNSKFQQCWFEQVAQKRHIPSSMGCIIIKKQLKQKMQNSKHKKRYSKISVEKRIKLVGLVLDQGLTITKAAKMLHVKRPTAKIIIKRYQRNGTYFQKKINNTTTKNNHKKDDQPKTQDISFEIALRHQQEPDQPRPQTDDSHCHDTLTLPATQGHIGFLFFYQPYFDFQCFM